MVYIQLPVQEVKNERKKVRAYKFFSILQHCYPIPRATVTYCPQWGFLISTRSIVQHEE